MEVGKEPGDAMPGADGGTVSKAGPEKEVLHAEIEKEPSVDGVQSHLEIPRESDNDYKIRERLETSADENGGDGKKNSVNEEEKEGADGDNASVQGIVSNNVEERLEALGDGKEGQQLEVNAGKEKIHLSKALDACQGTQNSQIPEGKEEIQKLGEHPTDEVPKVHRPEVKDKAAQLELSHAGEEIQKSREHQRDEVSQVKRPEGKESVEQSHANEEIQKLAECDGKEVQHIETSDMNGIWESKEQDSIGYFQHFVKTDGKEVIDNQDAETQIDDAAVVMTEHPSSENMEIKQADPFSTVNEKEDDTECLKLPVTAKCQAEAGVLERTLNSVFGAGVTASNTIIENDGYKLDVLSVVDFDTEVQPDNGMGQMEWAMPNDKAHESKEQNFETHEKDFPILGMENPKNNEEKSNSSLYLDGDESGTEKEQVLFFREVETFFKSRGTDFKPPKFYGEPLNLLKLWRAVIRLGGYEQVTSCKLWRQIGESFNPPKTCTTVSWTFRLFYEKALLEFEKHKMRDGDLPYDNSFTEFDTETQGVQSGGSQGPGSGRVRRDSAARAMQGWHSQRALSNGEIGDPFIKDKNLGSTQKREKHGKPNDMASLKRKTTSSYEYPSKLARTLPSRPRMEISVVDAGEPADWVKINVRKTKDCFEIYALIPGLMREEVRVQSDPAGRLVISGEPEQLDNPWGITPFKKVVSLPSRIDPHHTSAVVTLHGQLFVRIPFEQSDG